jgi:hypothetical protein
VNIPAEGGLRFKRSRVYSLASTLASHTLDANEGLAVSWAVFRLRRKMRWLSSIAWLGIWTTLKAHRGTLVGPRFSAITSSRPQDNPRSLGKPRIPTAALECRISTPGVRYDCPSASHGESDRNSRIKIVSWLALLTATSILSTFVLACATPFPAFAALAALRMRRVDAVLLVVATVLANQVVGFGFLHYPHTITCIAWGPALLIASWASMEAASFVAQRTRAPLDPLRALYVLVATMCVFKVAVFIFGAILGSNGSAFVVHFLITFLWTNSATFLVLMLLQRLAVAIGLVARNDSPARVAVN